MLHYCMHTLVPEAFCYSLFTSFATQTTSFIFSYWHEALTAEKRKPLVKTVGSLTLMPSAFDCHFRLDNTFNYCTNHRIGSIKYLWRWEWSVYTFTGRCGELLVYQWIFLPGKGKVFVINGFSSPGRVRVSLWCWCTIQWYCKFCRSW